MPITEEQNTHVWLLRQRTYRADAAGVGLVGFTAVIPILAVCHAGGDAAGHSDNETLAVGWQG